MAVPEENCVELIDRLAKRGVEATVIGTYTDSGQAHITYNDETIMDMTMDFLHDGNSETPLTGSFTRGSEAEPDLAEPADHAETLLDTMVLPNIASKEFVSRSMITTCKAPPCLARCKVRVVFTPMRVSPSLC